MSKKKRLTITVKGAYNDTKSRKVIRMLEENQDMRFSDIAKLAKVKIEKVYEINNAMERELMLLERIEFEEEKAERLLQQMEESKQRLEEAKKKNIEMLHYDEGFTVNEISIIVGDSPSNIRRTLYKIKELRGE